MSCALCQGRGSQVAYRLTGYDILRCEHCGLLYNSKYSSEDDAYSQDYYCRVQGNAFRFHGEQFLSDPSSPIYDQWLRQVEKNIPRGDVLDVGCGLGTFLAVAKKIGWRVRGLDVSAYASQQVREKLKIDVFTGSLADVPWSAGSFDLITFWDSIEHVSQPRLYLEKAKELLKPQGLMIISTDNFDCLIGDIAKAAYTLSGGAIRYPMQRLFIPYNATYFTDRQFRRMVEELGLEVLVSQKVEYPLSKISSNLPERLALWMLYLLAKMLRRQAQFTLLLRRKQCAVA